MKTVCNHCSIVSHNQPIGDGCHRCNSGTMQTPEVPFEVAFVQFELPDAEAMALAQFVKRCGWSDWERNAASRGEIELMRSAFSKLERALAREGYAPR